MIPLISWKNIWRNKVRSLVVIAAVTLGLFGGLFSSALFQGMSDRRVKEAVEKETAHIQLHHPRYIENPDIKFTITDSQSIEDFIEQTSGVQAATSRLKFTAMIASSSTSSGVNLIGVNPDKEKLVSKLVASLLTDDEIAKRYHTEDPDEIARIKEDSVGYYFENISRNPIFIGEELAQKLKLKVRSKVVLTFQNAEGHLTGAAFRVCGIFRTENSLFEETNVFVNQADLFPLTGLPAGSAHEIVVSLTEDHKTDQITSDLSDKYPELEVADWKKLQPDVGMLNDMMTVSMMIIMVIILLALGFGIVNTMLMVVMERVKEIGMLMAVGMSKGRIFRMIILESVLLSMTGALIGMGISILLISISSRQGIDLTAFAQQGFEAMGFSAVFYPSLRLDFYLIVTLMVIATGVLSSIYPAMKALKLNPADALRTE